MLQAASLPRAYVKATLPAAEAGSLSRVQLLEKGTGRLVQKIALAGCRPMGTRSVVHRIAAGTAYRPRSLAGVGYPGYMRP